MLRGLCLIGFLVALGLNVAPVDVASVSIAYGTTLAVRDGRPITRVTQEVPIEETYRRQCAACHGEHGRGDGRMARRFRPPPADFQDPDGIVKLTDEELVEVITGGRASMPSFGDVLSEDVIVALVTYVRHLSSGAVP